MNDYSLLNDPDMSEIFESFIVETKETLEKLDLDLVKLESSPDDADLLNEIFRSFHTVKGTSGFLGLVKMQSLTHRLEDILNKLRRGEAILTTPIMDGILKGYDTLGELLEIIENNKNEEYESEEITKELEEILKSMVGGKSEIVPEEKEELSLSNSAQDSISTDESDSHNPNLDDEITDIDLDEEELQKAFINNNKKLRSENKRGLPITAEITSLIEELPNPVNNEISASNSEIEVELNKNQTNELKTEKKENTDLSPENIEKKLQSKTGAEQTIRVDVDRLDELLNLVSELVLGRNRLSQINTDIAKEFEGTEISRNLGDTARQIDLLTTELQLAVMKTRMIKIGKVFNRFPRLVRDLSKETNKEIELVIKGEKTELDKTLIEEINDPLVHLIRNSVDHAIEPPEERIK